MPNVFNRLSRNITTSTSATIGAFAGNLTARTYLPGACANLGKTLVHNFTPIAGGRGLAHFSSLAARSIAEQNAFNLCFNIGTQAAPVVGGVTGSIAGYAATSALCWLAPKATKATLDYVVMPVGNATWNYIAKPTGSAIYNVATKALLL